MDLSEVQTSLKREREQSILEECVELNRILKVLKNSRTSAVKEMTKIALDRLQELSGGSGDDVVVKLCFYKYEDEFDYYDVKRYEKNGDDIVLFYGEDMKITYDSEGFENDDDYDSVFLSKHNTDEVVIYPNQIQMVEETYMAFLKDKINVPQALKYIPR